MDRKRHLSLDPRLPYLVCNSEKSILFAEKFGKIP